MTFKSEHGNYSDGFRKAFHHETITYNRSIKRPEFVEIDAPRLSALLSGTPKQVAALIPMRRKRLIQMFYILFHEHSLRVERCIYWRKRSNTRSLF